MTPPAREKENAPAMDERSGPLASRVVASRPPHGAAAGLGPGQGTEPSIGQVFIGPGAVYYVATQTDKAQGYVTRVTAK